VLLAARKGTKTCWRPTAPLNIEPSGFEILGPYPPVHVHDPHRRGEHPFILGLDCKLLPQNEFRIGKRSVANFNKWSHGGKWAFSRT